MWTSFVLSAHCTRRRRESARLELSHKPGHRQLRPMLLLTGSSFGLLAGGRPQISPSRAAMSLDPADWKLLRKEADEGFVLDAASPGFEVQLLQATIPRSADAPSLGLLLEEIAGSEDAGIVAIEGLVSGGNGEQASLALEPGDALVGAIEVGGRAVSLEGLNYDGVLEVLGGLDASKALELQAPPTRPPTHSGSCSQPLSPPPPTPPRPLPPLPSSPPPSPPPPTPPPFVACRSRGW